MSAIQAVTSMPLVLRGKALSSTGKSSPAPRGATAARTVPRMNFYENTNVKMRYPIPSLSEDNYKIYSFESTNKVDKLAILNVADGIRLYMKALNADRNTKFLGYLEQLQFLAQRSVADIIAELGEADPSEEALKILDILREQWGEVASKCGAVVIREVDNKAIADFLGNDILSANLEDVANALGAIARLENDKLQFGSVGPGLDTNYNPNDYGDGKTGFDEAKYDYSTIW